LPYASPENFVFGENAACSLVLSLVQYYDEDNYSEYLLLREDEKTIAEGNDFESLVLREKGYYFK
jgi:hypothetical protein